MVDPNTGASMLESDDIIKYLTDTYGDGSVPITLRLGMLTVLMAGLGTIPRCVSTPEEIRAMRRVVSAPTCDHDDASHDPWHVHLLASVDIVLLQLKFGATRHACLQFAACEPHCGRRLYTGLAAAAGTAARRCRGSRSSSGATNLRRSRASCASGSPSSRSPTSSSALRC